MIQYSENQIKDAIQQMAKVGKCWSPSFSPDSQQLAFVSDITGLPQVWRLPVSGGFPQLVTALDDQVTQVQWSPSGDWLAFECAPGGGMNTQIYIIRPDGTDLSQLSTGGKTNNWLGSWTADGQAVVFSSNMRQADSMDSYQVDIETGDIKILAQNNGVGRIENLSSDQAHLLISRVVYRGDNNIVLVDNSSAEETLLTPHQPPASFANARFTPDKQDIYLISNKDRDLTELVKMPLDAIDQWTSIISRESAELVEFALSPKDSLVALIWNMAGRTELELFNLETNTRIKTFDLSAEIIGSLRFSSDGLWLAMCITGSRTPMDISVLDMTDYTIQQLTFSPHAGVNLDTLVKPTLETYSAHDDLTLTGWLYTPLDAEAPFPMVLSFHGGPEAQEQPRFRADYQALLAQGIGVFAPNVRGSSGFGKRFVNLDNGALRVDAVQDIQSTVNFLVEQGITQVGHIGIMGGSYGGYMTMAGLAEFPDLFSAGANLYGVVNFKTFFEQTEAWMASISKIEYGDPDTEGDMLDALSPINKLDSVNAPTLVLHGANDTNVPVIEAEQVVEQLKARGIPVDYILFADEGHGFRKEENRITSATAIVEWFMTYL